MSSSVYLYDTGSNSQVFTDTLQFGITAIVGGNISNGYAPIVGITFRKIKWFLSSSASSTVTITCYYKQGGSNLQFGDSIVVDLSA
jgi:hypothetical protein